MQALRVFHTGAVTSLILLFLWLLAWEIFVAPLHPGGSLLALKALPLLLPLRGVLKRDLYTLQWSSMVILIYLVEGIVRAWSDRAELSRLMALGEVLLVGAYFLFAVLYLRPYKKQAQKLAKELLDKVKVPHD
jgi:uncharacterized membrane protein